MKKIISLLLCALLILGTFMGCSGKKDNEDTSAPNGVAISYTVDAHNSYINQSAVRAYETLCEAVINGSSSALFNTSLIDDVNRLFYSDFPLSYLVNRLEINSDNSGVNIIYDNDTEKHLEAVAVFRERLGSILSECGYGKVNNNVLILNLYSYITKNTVLTSKSSYSYDVIVNSLGYSFSLAGAFSYLLNQAGIKASVVHSTNENGICYMVETEFKGDKYIFNPFFEADENEGKALCYFALDYSELADMGFKDIKYSNGDGVAFDDNENRFEQFRNSVAYILEENNLSVTKNNGEIVQVAL